MNDPGRIASEFVSTDGGVRLRPLAPDDAAAHFAICVPGEALLCGTLDVDQRVVAGGTKYLGAVSCRAR